MKNQSIAPANPYDPPEGSDVRLRDFGGFRWRYIAAMMLLALPTPLLVKFDFDSFAVAMYLGVFSTWAILTTRFGWWGFFGGLAASPVTYVASGFAYIAYLAITGQDIMPVPN